MTLNVSTEALARASARRPWLVVAAWVAVFAVSVALIFNLLSDALTNEFGFTGNPDSKQADTLLEERLRGPEFPEGVTAFRPEFAVHGKYKKPCPVCGAPVQRIRHAENETNYCARCQTGGKVLADRSLSRFLKEDWPRSIEELENRA